MHAWWEAWRSSVPGCLVDSVLEHLVERGDCLHMHVHGWRVIQRLLVVVGLGIHELFLGAWSIKFSSLLVERICGTPVPS
jgi:hypothetical protein